VCEYWDIVWAPHLSNHCLTLTLLCVVCCRALTAEPISINAETDKAMRKPKKEDAPSFVMFQTTTEKLKKDAFNQERKVSTCCMAVILVVP
jgi:hypothetical protein